MVILKHIIYLDIIIRC